MMTVENKKIPSPFKNWISVRKYLEIQRKNMPYYGDLYHYAGNNPVRYVDPDGKTEVYFIFALDTNNALTPEGRAKNIEINNYIQNSMDNAFKELFIQDLLLVQLDNHILQMIFQKTYHRHWE